MNKEKAPKRELPEELKPSPKDVSDEDIKHGRGPDKGAALEDEEPPQAPKHDPVYGGKGVQGGPISEHEDAESLRERIASGETAVPGDITQDAPTEKKPNPNAGYGPAEGDKVAW